MFLPLEVDDVSGHLLADWVPSLPPSVGSSFMGWPPFLLESTMLRGSEILALRPETRRSERQWKGVLSWMLGVAGARHVLKREGYRWVAPLSAFYPGISQPVDLSAWHPSFPPSRVVADRLPESRSRLRPDYVALRSTSIGRSGGRYQWAVVEAKGTQKCLTSASECPPAWSNQSHNIVVSVNGSRITIPRHLVIATRVNPNASRPIARRIQVRAWNHSDQPENSLLPHDGVIEIVSAHLFGLFKGIGLPENALAIALSVQGRRSTWNQDLVGTPADVTARVSERAERELFGRTRRSDRQTEDAGARALLLETQLGPVEIDIVEPVLKLARRLRHPESPEAAATALQEIDSELDVWEESRPAAESSESRVTLPFGVELHLPRRANEQ